MPINPEYKLKPLKGNKLRMYNALEASLGIVTAAAKMCKMNYATHYLWLNNDPNYKEWIEHLNEKTVDFVESALHKQIKEGNPTSTIFYLKTKGKHRGYIERKEIVNEFSGGLTVDSFAIAWNEAKKELPENLSKRNAIDVKLKKDDSDTK